MNSLSSRKLLIALAVAIAILTLYFVPLGGHSLLEPDEGRYSEIPREMIESGNFITPKLNYVKYFEKPVLLYWMNAASFMAFGQNEFAARFATALCAVTGALVTAGLGTFIFGYSAGLLAGIVTALSLLYFAVGTINLTDMPLAFFLTLALASFYVGHIKNDRRWYIAFYAAMALGLLTKGLIAIVLPGGVIFWYIILTRKWRLFIEALYLPGIIIFFAISVPWFYLVCRDNHDFFYFFFIHEHFLRYATRIHDRYEPFWFFLPMIPAGLMPWTGFLFSLSDRESVVRTPEDSAGKDAVIFLLLWFGVILLFFSLSKSKLIPYIAPCIPPLAILIGADIDRMITRGKWHGGALAWSFGIALLFSAALFAYPLFDDHVAAHDAFRIALKFAAGLLIGPVSAILLTRGKNKNFKAAAAALAVSAFIFIAGQTSIYDIMGRTRSTHALSEVIIKEKLPDETIAVYGDILQGVPFYTKQRVMLVDTMGELRFGAKQSEGEGWFPSKKQFLEEWRGKRPFVLVLPKKQIKGLFPDGIEPGTKIIEADKYILLFNRRGK